MGTARATKAADKSQVCRKLVQSLQKLYGKSVPKIELSVVETLLFATCLEDNPWAVAEASFRKMLTAYFDLNEIRVSSVSELEDTLAPLKDASWKGLRIRSVLRYIFETTYSYDFEKLRRQTLEQAVKTLKKINDISPFIRDFVLHEILGSHVVCLDNSMLAAARWLGLVPANADLHEATEFLRGGVKKAEVSEFCFLLRCLATDPKFVPRFLDLPGMELTVDDVQDRFTELQSPPKKKPAKPAEPAPANVKKSAAGTSENAAGAKSSAPSKPIVAPKPGTTVRKGVPEIPQKPAAKPSVASKPTAAKATLPAAKPLAPKPTAAKPAGKPAAVPAERKGPPDKSSAGRKPTPPAKKPTKK